VKKRRKKEGRNAVKPKSADMYVRQPNYDERKSTMGFQMSYRWSA